MVVVVVEGGPSRVRVVYPPMSPASPMGRPLLRWRQGMPTRSTASCNRKRKGKRQSGKDATGDKMPHRPRAAT